MTKRVIGPSYKPKELPKGVKYAWYYKGKDPSVHIVLKPIQRQVKIADGIYITIFIEPEQINLKLK